MSTDFKIILIPPFPLRSTRYPLPMSINSTCCDLCCFYVIQCIHIVVFPRCMTNAFSYAYRDSCGVLSATCGAGTTYLSGGPEFTLGLYRSSC